MFTCEEHLQSEISTRPRSPQPWWDAARTRILPHPGVHSSVQTSAASALRSLLAWSSWEQWGGAHWGLRRRDGTAPGTVSPPGCLCRECSTAWFYPPSFRPQLTINMSNYLHASFRGVYFLKLPPSQCMGGELFCRSGRKIEKLDIKMQVLSPFLILLTRKCFQFPIKNHLLSPIQRKKTYNNFFKYTLD